MRGKHQLRLAFAAALAGARYVVTDAAAVPRAAPADTLLQAGSVMEDSATVWNPARSPSGPVSIIVSAADRRMLVLRNGIAIGSAPARIEGPITGTSAFLMRSGEAGAPSWIEVSLPGSVAAASPTRFAGRVQVADEMRALVAPLLAPGTSVIITPDSLRAASPLPVEVLGGEADAPAR